MKNIYFLSLAGSLLAAILIYFVFFDSFSETTLIQMTAFWFLPLIFGLYGLVATKIFKKGDAGTPSYADVGALNQHGGLLQKTKQLGSAAGIGAMRIPYVSLLLMLGLLPLTLSKKAQSPLQMALIGTAIWAGLLFVFLVVIFPML